MARVMHDSGPRAHGPFIEVNCAAIPDTMLEAELFGFEPGAFTDAKRAKPVLFEAAVGGTLLLDEVDALPLALQGKLLTAIETKRVRRLGAVAERAVDVKLIAATNAVLEQRIATGHLRADLYHRLAVVVLALPPLRERGEDALLLAARLLGVSRDAVRYRIQRDGIARPQPELTPLPAPLHAPQAGLLDSPLRDGQEGQVPAERADVPTSSMARGKDSTLGRTSRAFPPLHRGDDPGSRAPSCSLILSTGNKLTTSRCGNRSSSLAGYAVLFRKSRTTRRKPSGFSSITMWAALSTWASWALGITCSMRWATCRGRTSVSIPRTMSVGHGMVAIAGHRSSWGGRLSSRHCLRISTS